MPTDRVHRLPQQAQLRAIRPHRPQPSTSDAATQRRHARPAPNERRCTRYVAMHPLRRDTPDQKGCNAYGSGAPPPTTSTTADSCSPFTHSRSVSRRPCTRHCTRSVALHPFRRAAPDPSRYTRSEGVHCLRIGCIAYGSGAPHNAGTHHRRLCRPRTYHPQAGTHETTKPQAPTATTEHGLTGNTSQPTGQARKPHPKHDEAAAGFPATASSRSVSATQRSAATDQAVMSTWSSTAARPASRRATGTRNGEQDT